MCLKDNLCGARCNSLKHRLNFSISQLFENLFAIVQNSFDFFYSEILKQIVSLSSFYIGLHGNLIRRTIKQLIHMENQNLQNFNCLNSVYRVCSIFKTSQKYCTLLYIFFIVLNSLTKVLQRVYSMFNNYYNTLSCKVDIATYMYT